MRLLIKLSEIELRDPRAQAAIIIIRQLERNKEPIIDNSNQNQQEDYDE